MTAPKTALTAVLESVTLKLNKEGDIASSAKLSSLDSPGRLGALSGKGLKLDSQTGKRQMAVTAKSVTHKIDTTGERPRIKTVLTVIGDGGLEKMLGHTVDLSVLQEALPGMEEDEGEEEEK